MRPASENALPEVLAQSLATAVGQPHSSIPDHMDTAGVLPGPKSGFCANPGYPERKSWCRAVCWSSWFCLSPKPACPDPLFGQTYGGNSPHHARRILNELARSELLIIHQGLVGVWSTRCSSKRSEQIFGTSGSVLIYRDVRTGMLSSALQHTVVVALQQKLEIRSKAEPVNIHAWWHEAAQSKLCGQAATCTNDRQILYKRYLMKIETTTSSDRSQHAHEPLR